MPISPADSQTINNFLSQNKTWSIKNNKLHKTFLFQNFIEAFAFMTKIALIAEKSDHHPEWFNVYNKIVVDLTTHEANGITQRDIILAETMDKLSSNK